MLLLQERRDKNKLFTYGHVYKARVTRISEFGISLAVEYDQDSLLSTSSEPLAPGLASTDAADSQHGHRSSRAQTGATHVGVLHYDMISRIKETQVTPEVLKRDFRVGKVIKARSRLFLFIPSNHAWSQCQMFVQKLRSLTRLL